MGELAKLGGKAFKRIKILTIDIESRPHLVWVWDLFNIHYVGIDQIKEPGGMMCFAAKWLHEKNTLFYSDYHDGHRKMLEECHRLLSEADVVVTYNGDRYDIRRINNEFILAGMHPVRPFQSVDLIKTNKIRFDLPSRKLDYLVQSTGLGAKVKHEGFPLWVRCMNGDPEAWADMKRYNIGDVKVTEKAYLMLIPWLVSPPHLGVYIDERTCPFCGSGGKKVRWDGKTYTHTKVQKYPLYQCSNCHGWVRGTKAVQDSTGTRPVR